MEKRFLTFEEAASVLRVSRPTLWRYIANKTVPSTKVGRRVLVPAKYFDDLENTAVAGLTA